MQPERYNRTASLIPLIGAFVVIFAWYVLTSPHLLPGHTLQDSVIPSPAGVVRAFGEELRSNRLLDDMVSSLFRVTLGFTIAVLLGIPAGLWLGLHASSRAVLLPHVNFLRSLSSLAWIPFAIAWFGVGDASVIFLIVMGTLFPLMMAVAAAVSHVPQIYFRVARDYGVTGRALIGKVTLPAIMPQVITTLRMLAGMAWVVVVAAEMVAAGRGGLGYAIYDARNGLRPDIVVVEMIVIGTIGVVIDRILLRMTNMPSLRWGYER